MAGKNIRSIVSSTEEYIALCKKAHGDKFDYSRTVYTRAMDKVHIDCCVCGS
jgi:hypothetical protein